MSATRPVSKLEGREAPYMAVGRRSNSSAANPRLAFNDGGGGGLSAATLQASITHSFVSCRDGKSDDLSMLQISVNASGSDTIRRVISAA